MLFISRICCGLTIKWPRTVICNELGSASPPYQICCRTFWVPLWHSGFDCCSWSTNGLSFRSKDHECHGTTESTVPCLCLVGLLSCKCLWLGGQMFQVTGCRLHKMTVMPGICKCIMLQHISKCAAMAMKWSWYLLLGNHIMGSYGSSHFDKLPVLTQRSYLVFHFVCNIIKSLVSP